MASADDVEIAHEALLTGWPRLLGWLDDGRVYADIRARLTVVATEWETDGRDEAELYAGTRLQAALDTQAASPGDLSPLETTFLAESTAYAERALIEQRHRADREARGRRRTRAVAVGLAAALALAAAAGGFAVHQRSEAEQAARTAQAAAVSADAGRLGAIARKGGDYDLALLYATQAVKLDPSPQSLSDLFATLERGSAVTSVAQTPGVETSLAFSPDGTVVAGLAEAGQLTLWPAQGGPQLSTVDLDADVDDTRNLRWLTNTQIVAGTPGGPAVVDPRSGARLEQGPGSPGSWSLSRDGRSLVSLVDVGPGEASTRVLVWQRGTPASQARSVDMGTWVASTHPCGEAACVLTWDGTVVRISYRDGRRLSSHPLPRDCDPGHAVTSGDGSRLAIWAENGLVRVIDPRTGAEVDTLAAGTSDWLPLAFTDDGSSLAVRDFDSVVVWHVGTTALPDRLLGHSGRVTAAAFSPDGTSLATAGDDRSLMMWDLSGERGLAHVVTRDLPTEAITLWATASHAVLGENDGVVRLVDLSTGRIESMSGGTPHHEGRIITARTGRLGSLLVTADTLGVTAVWDLATRALLGTVSLPPPDSVHGSDTWVSPDGRYAATIRTDAGPIVIDLETRTVARRLPPLPATDEPATLTLVQGWSPDGRDLYLTRVGPGGNELLTVDATSGAVRMRTLVPGDTPNEVAPDPRGRFLALAMDSGSVAFVDPGTGALLAPPTTAITGKVFNVSVSTDSRFVSATGSTAQLTLWDTSTFREVGTPLSLQLGETARARFASGGPVIVSNGTTLWSVEVDPAAWVARACREAGRTLTRAEWAEVLPNRAYDPACSSS